jgi:hypothetical protein
MSEAVKEIRFVYFILEDIGIEVELPIVVKTDNKWKLKFKFCRESLCTSPSGVHLGHFKALTETIYVIDETQLVPDLEIPKMQQEIFG